MTACLGTPSRPGDSTRSDARTDSSPDAPGACAQFGPWKNPHRLDFGTALDDETGAWLSPDGLDLWYSDSTTTPSIHHARRSDTSTFTFAQQPPTDLGWEFCDPFLSDDQLEMWHETFTDTRAIWHASRLAPDVAFNDDIELFHDAMQYAGPSVTTDKKTMVLSVSVGGLTDDSRRLYVATRNALDERFGTPSVIAELNGTNIDFSPSIAGDDNSRDGRTLVYSEDAGDGKGWDVYLMERDCL